MLRRLVRRPARGNFGKAFAASFPFRERRARRRDIELAGKSRSYGAAR